MIVIMVATVLGAVACHKAAPPIVDAVPAREQMSESIRFQFAVYLLRGTGKDPQDVLREEIRSKFKSLKLVAEVPKQPKEMVVSVRAEKDAGRKYAPPDLDGLKSAGVGLSPQQEQALQKASEAWILDFGHPKEHVWDGLRTADELIEDLARKTGGLVWDNETKQIYSPDAWRETRLDSWTEAIPDLSTQIRGFVDKNGEFARAVSTGMIKVGLPDVYVESLAWTTQDQIIDAANLFCQAMAEGATFDGSGKFTLKLQDIRNKAVSESEQKDLQPNATGVAYLVVRKGKPEDGDPDNRLIELSAERYEGEGAQAKQALMISCLLGRDESLGDITFTEELMAASRKARDQLPELFKALHAPLKDGEYIEVKAPFHRLGNEEIYLWIEVTKWENDAITGVLEDVPTGILGLRSGQVVKVQEDDVFDYIRHYEDGHTEGDTTQAIIDKQEHPAEKAKKSPSGRARAECVPR